MGSVYCVTNLLNGKQYVGMTIGTISQRWSHHKCATSVGSGYLLHRAIRKYGPESFAIKKIDFAESLQDLKEREIFHIAALHSLAPKGYNLTEGGEGTSGWIPSEETRAKLSRSSRTVSNETRRKMSASHIKDCCRSGHPYDAKNTYIIPSTGGRRCLICYFTSHKLEFPEALHLYASSIGIGV